ncbi:hypothetical protein SAMN05878437_0131 [Vreelandella subglaciescola]|uniref:Uncharacterized protein n=1 Tax=Vreelandella subglaciescola TaxID=29571 RepID=A0A1M7ECR8_9GAMM|nr:hypothetical protein SAMN05878437_0131 [Halomonas subglaciescola]
MLLRETLDNSGMIAALEDHLVDHRYPDRGDLLLHAFFLVTNLSQFDWPPEKVLALYRKRGSAEAHMGEVKSSLDVHLSSTDRGASSVQDVMARNEVSLLLSLYAYQVLHGAALPVGTPDPAGLEPEADARAGTQGSRHAGGARPAHHRAPRRCRRQMVAILAERVTAADGTDTPHYPAFASRHVGHHGG